jgi:formamidase
VILVTAPVEGMISGIVYIPNCCCTLYVPTDIFERNIYPDEIPRWAPDEGDIALTS